MNTKTMRLPPRRVLTPSSSNTTSNKRKERDDSFERPRPKPIDGPNSKLLKPDKPISKLSGSEPFQSATTAKKTTTMPSNQLLAGYLAHEFLTKGTLMGQPWVPSRGKEEDDDVGGEEGEATEAPPCRRPETKKIEKERYVEVTALLKGGGTHLPGVVNPSQLARFLDL